ncbi:MAG TPA: hypothetical protein VFL93_05370 [Longimicrobiaceae bacterium]|nr:hypothetical protein [Longimicrobiaceae bacterium]
MSTEPTILPYRTDASALSWWLEARARGRAPGELRAAARSTKGAEGTAATAAALGLADAETGELTEAGRRFALASPDERRDLTAAAIRRHAPYRRLLDAVAARGDAVTEVGWMETWWAAHGYGNSASNRQEGAAVLGRLAEFAGLGRYVPGRRGHPTRVAWAEGALERPAPERAAVPVPREAVRGAAGGPEPRPAVRGGAGDDLNRVVIPLGDGRTARFELPARLPAEEKRRLMALLDLLITAE